MSTSIPAYAAPYFLEFVSAHAAKGDEEAQRIMARVKPAKHVPKPPLPDRKSAKREEHREATKDLRAHAWERCGGTLLWDGDEHEGEWRLEGFGRCECCGDEMGTAFDLHHTESGGVRRSNQRPGSVLAICMPCHRLAHRNDLPTLVRIAAAVPLDDQAREVVKRRVRKIEGMRKVTP